jgi:hypothetical protein
MDEEVNEHQLLRDQERAARAQALLGNELLQEAFKTLEERYMRAWRDTGMSPNDTHARERLFQAVNIVGKVREHLERVIEGGKLAKRQIEDIERRKEMGFTPYMP